MIYLICYPCWAHFLFSDTDIFAFYFTTDGTGSWNYYSWKSRTCLSCTVNTMIAGDLVMQGAKASANIVLTHWGRATHICVGNLTIIGSDNGLSPGRRQGIIWTNDGIVLIQPLGTNFNEISIAIHAFSFKKMHFKMSSAKWRPFCLGLNVLT